MASSSHAGLSVLCGLLTFFATLAPEHAEARRRYHERHFTEAFWSCTSWYQGSWFLCEYCIQCTHPLWGPQPVDCDLAWGDGDMCTGNAAAQSSTSSDSEPGLELLFSEESGGTFE